MTEPERVAPSEAERHAKMFPHGAPDVAIAALDIMRATITEVDDPDDDSEDGLSWHVYGFPAGEGERHPLVLAGDLSCHDRGWFVGCTALATIAFRDPASFDREDWEQVHSVSRYLGMWATHVLYDVAASRARSLVGSSARCRIEIPVATPTTHIARVGPSSEDEVGSGSS